MLAILQGLVFKFSPCEIVLGTVVMFFNVMMDLIPLQMILALFQLNSNYFLKQFSLHFCSEGLIIRFYGFCIANKVLFFLAGSIFLIKLEIYL